MSYSKRFEGADVVDQSSDVWKSKDGIINNRQQSDYDGLNSALKPHNKSRFGSNNKKNISIVLDQISKCMDEYANTDKKKIYSKKYYHKRKSYGQIFDIHHDREMKENKNGKFRCIDDSQRSVEVGEKKIEKNTEQINNNGFNIFIHQVLKCDDIIMFITNPKVLVASNPKSGEKRSRKRGNSVVSSHTHLIQLRIPELMNEPRDLSPAKVTIKKLSNPKKRNEKIFLKLTNKRKSFGLSKMESDTTIKLGYNCQKVDPKTVLKAIQRSDQNVILNDYVPICLFLTIYKDRLDLGTKLLFYDPTLSQKVKPALIKTLLHDQSFICLLLKNILKYEESNVFLLFLRFNPQWDILFSEPVLSIYINMDKHEEMYRFLKEFNIYLRKQDQALKQGKGISTFTRRNLENSNLGEESPQKHNDNEADEDLINLIGISRIVVIVKKLFQEIESSESCTVIMNLLRR